MKKQSQQELLKLIDFVTDRFFGERVVPHLLVSAINDYRQQYYEQSDGDAFSEARAELKQEWEERQHAE